MKRTDYFQESIRRDAETPALPLMPSPCHDCAVVCGFYEEYTEALALEPKETQMEFSKKWFCHNNRTLACRGNANVLSLTWEVT